MKYEVLSTFDEQWNKCLNEMPSEFQDIYFTSDYHKLCELNGDGKGKIFIFTDGKNLGIYPFMINEIKGYDLKEKYYDIETVYGYGGPIVKYEDEIFTENFEKSFLEYCKNEKVVAEFIRYHPILGNHNLFKKNIEVIANRTTVYLDLDKDLEYIWMNDISRSNRSTIRKAKNSNVIITYSKNSENFKTIYKDTMNKLNANKNYYFTDEYYKEMNSKDNFNFISAEKDGKVIASAVFTIYGEYCNYHLSGSYREYLNYAPNNIILWEAIKYAHSNVCKYFYLGGGLTNDEKDSLFKFKKSFSKNTKEYYIGKRVHNKIIYDYLINTWEQKNNTKSNMLLQYKY